MNLSSGWENCPRMRQNTVTFLLGLPVTRKIGKADTRSIASTFSTFWRFFAVTISSLGAFLIILFISSKVLGENSMFLYSRNDNIFLAHS